MRIKISLKKIVLILLVLSMIASMTPVYLISENLGVQKISSKELFADEPKAVSIFYYVDGNVYTDDIGLYGEAIISAPNPAPQSSGKSFNGWSIVANGDQKNWIFGDDGTTITIENGVMGADTDYPIIICTYSVPIAAFQ